MQNYKLIAPRKIRKVWIITFEYSPIVKVGGLGEAVYQFSRALSKEGIDVTIIMPSHGRHLDLSIRSKYNFTPLNFTACGERTGLDGKNYSYCIGAEEANINGIKIILFKGLDYYTGIIFDSWNVYSNVEEKSALLTRSVKIFAWHENPPDLIHINDWHTVLSGIALRDELEKRGISVPLVYTIHLSGSPNFPWHYASDKWAGLDNNYHKIWKVSKHEPMLYEKLWNQLNGNVEAFGVYVSDFISTVSRSYLTEELFSRYGNWIEGKSCVVYNTTDWDVKKVEKWIQEKYGFVGKEIAWDIIKDYIRSSSWSGYDINDSSKAIMLVVGRLTSQKGIDLAIRALDYAPSVNLVILGVSVGDYGYEQYIKHLLEERRGRAIITTTKIHEDAYKALFRVSASLVMPSRWEPFGLVAIESLSQGTPVIANSVGGLKEIVDDIRSGKGNGLLVKPEDTYELGLAMESIANLMWYMNFNMIPMDSIRDMALKNNMLPEEIRSNAINKVDMNFRINNQIEQLKSCYEKARVMSYYRTL